MFADLAGFTALTEAHGDERAADLADEFSRAERDAISYAVKRGKVVVAAVGNSPDNAGHYASWPAALRHVIGVSAVTQTLAWAPLWRSPNPYTLKNRKPDHAAGCRPAAASSSAQRSKTRFDSP